MENWTTERIIKEFNLDKSFVFFDIGTNLGQELETLLPLGIEIHSFEPHPKMAKYIRERFESYDNMTFNECAAWIKNEDKIFYHKRDPESQWTADDGSTLIREKTNISGEYLTKVRCIDISEYILNLKKKINIIKMDIEGSEYHIIKHLINTGTIEKIENIFFEDHSRKISSNCLEFYENRKFVFDRLSGLNTKFGYW